MRDDKASKQEKIRNFGIIAHIDAGKTTTTERILYYTRRIHRMGSVDEGTTTTDWYAEERRRGISIFSAVTTVFWKGFQLNLIDTPGHVDFTAEVERSLRVLDGAVVVFCGVGGVEAQSETVWRQADRYAIPRLCYINKLDRVGSDYDRVLDQIRSQLNARPVPVTIPLGTADRFEGVIDLIRKKAIRFDEESQGEVLVESDIPPERREMAEAFRAALVEVASEFDDGVLSRLVEGAEPSEEEVRAGLLKGTRLGKIFPTFAGSSLKNKGVQPLLDGIAHYLPSPLDRPIVRARVPGTERPVELDVRKEKRPCALVFKTFTDPHGELSYLRVYTGEVRTGEGLYNPRAGRMERITRLYRMHANEREAVDHAIAGDIVAAVGLKATVTGDTLCDKSYPLTMEPIRFPGTVVSVAIEPRHGGDREKLLEVLAKLSKDDPTFRTQFDPETGQILIHGMGELHLEIIRHRIAADFNTPINAGAAKVSYKETVTERAQAEEHYSARVQDRTISAHISVRIEPVPDMTDTAVEIDVDPETARRAAPFLPAIVESLRSGALSGNLAGYPIIGMKVTVTGMTLTPDSNEVAFSIAASNALRRALGQVSSILLEPYMRFEIRTPPGSQGPVIEDLNRRNATVESTDAMDNLVILRGTAPLSKMFGYANTLRSLTQGRGYHTMEPAGYRAVPEQEVRQMFGGFLGR